MSRLSEKIIEYFCFHHKNTFQVRGISETEREAFCANIHAVRQIRHCAVHRVPVGAITIARYAKMVRNILLVSKRLGGTEFKNTYGGPVRSQSEDLWITNSIDITCAEA